jgi:hypothetical protein
MNMKSEKVSRITKITFGNITAFLPVLGIKQSESTIYS